MCTSEHSRLLLTAIYYHDDKAVCLLKTFDFFVYKGGHIMNRMSKLAIVHLQKFLSEAAKVQENLTNGGLVHGGPHKKAHYINLLQN